MERNTADKCGYVRNKRGQVLNIAFCVDDILIGCSDDTMLLDTKVQLPNHFKINNLGESRTILGLYIYRDQKVGTLNIDQSRFAARIIKRSGLQSARGINAPRDPALGLNHSSSTCAEPHCNAIGSLIYPIVGTRFDFAYSIWILASFVEKPTTIH